LHIAARRSTARSEISRTVARASGCSARSAFLTRLNFGLIQIRSAVAAWFGEGPPKSASSSSDPLCLPHPDHRRTGRVLNLEPVPRRARQVWRAQPFRHDAFGAHLAGLLEDQAASSRPVAARFVANRRKFDQAVSPNRLVVTTVGRSVYRNDLRTLACLLGKAPQSQLDGV
jgi:hypothetical protein